MIKDFIRILNEIISLQNKEGCCADDLLTAAVYTLIKSQPKKMHSNFRFHLESIPNLYFIFRFIKFMRPKNGIMTNEEAFCLANVESAINFIEKLNFSKLYKITSNEFIE